VVVQTGVDLRDKAEALRREVAARFGAAPGTVRVVRSPYRVCPLGAHIDHQLGPVTAMALDRGVLLAYVPSPNGEVRVDSLDFAGPLRFRLDDVPGRAGDWGDIPRGVALALGSRYRLDRGIVGVVAGKLHGGGVSSSAAVGVSFLLALQDVNGLRLAAEETVELGQRVENDYLGLSNGILDQAAVLLSRRGHLTLTDCRTSRHDRIGAAPWAPPFQILLIFSGLTRPLVETNYNRRVAECAEAARVLLAAVGRAETRPVLGEVMAGEYEAFRHVLHGAPARRAAHFFSESDRVRRGVDAWRAGDLAGFGRLVTASGESSVHNYECGNPPLIDLFHDLVAADGVYGARFSGAGFRGCCVALVDPQAASAVAERVSAAHARRYPELAAGAAAVLCDSGDGAGFLHAPAHENGRNGDGAAP
jgi:galacturonokinase